MHACSYSEMERRLGEYFAASNLPAGAVVVDIGSQNINGSYRALVPDGFQYIGVDKVDGRNVNVVMRSDYDTGLDADLADIVISGQCLEHVRNPFRLMAEIARITKPGGGIFIAAPFQFPIHRFPIDCWRFLPDGMRAVFEDAGLECLEAYVAHGVDCWGVGRKPGC